ncbi:MAG: 2Fe-2S iron-sulfur cluster binding domain-containing protein [Calditrichaeota bacterium]|nr:2Fe-2S iron-sulfur cluster binding domain-containing protein [Calditrichota bacterium]MBT7788357.1 2Fe-2S iron-sulfur cluster binding domain-containing protein [Calditrichota bacterium]
MPKIKINGNEHEFPEGMNVLEACKNVGIYVPHFCYHPLLRTVGSCRMCKVEVSQNMRGSMQSRIDISCKVEVADGMEIRTDTPEVKKQQQMTLEFLLSNHPLDCPVCDDAGECELQNFYFEFGQHDSRMIEPKIKNRKAFDIGRSIVLDNERCVLCSRCSRFLEEVTHTHELGIFGMGSAESIMLKPGARLDNDYAGNVVDLCPVGALTDKDYRFKRRVWYLKSTPSICEHCARGCNVRVDWDLNPYHWHKKTFQMRKHRTEATDLQRIQRIKPRRNDAVNKEWICDTGRYGYKSTDSADRLTQPVINESGELKPVEAGAVIKAFVTGLNSAIKSNPGKVAVVVSPKLTNEEIYAAWSLFRKRLELPNLDHKLPVDPEWTGDDLLKSADPFPNRLGCEWIGFVPDGNGLGVEDLNLAISNGKIDTLLTILADPREFLEEKSLSKLKRKFFILRNLPEDLKEHVDAALPAAAWGEYRGTFTNFEGRIQRLEAAFDPEGEAQPVWHWMIELATGMKKSLKWRKTEDIMHSLSDHVINYKNLSYDSIGPEGVVVGDKA